MQDLLLKHHNINNLRMSDHQSTIQSEVTLKGIGLHTGKEVKVVFKPAPENHGIVFERSDLEQKVLIPADVDYVVDTARGTTLKKDNATIATVEHALAAVTGLSIDNILISVDGPELPILDGSAKLFVEALSKAGKVSQIAERKYFELKTNVFYSDPNRGVEIIAIPSDAFKVKVMIDFNSKVLGSQHAFLDNIDEFQKEIAPCRTFVFLHELKMLYNSGLIKGGDVSNAIVYVDKSISDDDKKLLAAIFEKPEINVTQEGILDNVELQFQNESARHKLLDVVGDLALVGMPIKAQIIATRPGHAANIEFAKKIKQLIKVEKNKKVDVPVYDPSTPPIYNINDISRILPHRHPFLLVDKIIEISENQVIGIKNVTMNEDFFRGHFPGNPIMPGVLQVEAMAQVGGILTLNTVEDPENYSTYFMKIDNVKFKQKVIPGDTLIFKLELMSPIRRGICHMKGQAFVGDKLVSEAEMMAQIVKDKGSSN